MDISISNVHLDLGAGRRGTDMGPSAMHVAGLVPSLERLGHRVAGVRTIGRATREGSVVGDPKLRFLDVIREACVELADHVETSCDAGHKPLVLGGDHSQAIGTVSGLARHYRRDDREIAVCWVDAHTDMNTPESSPTGNIHGMPLAVLLGHGERTLTALAGARPALRAEHVVVFGARDVDLGEAELIKRTGVRVFTMSEIDARGAGNCIDEAMTILSRASGGIHLSYDLDGSDPSVAPGVGTPVPGGLNFRESHLACEAIARSGRLIGMEMVELNPTLDFENKTGKFAVWLIQSAFGRKIL